MSEEIIGLSPIVTERFVICDVDIGNDDRDRSGTSKYAAPSGYRILGHEIKRSGHHSGTDHVSTDQPGELSYDNSVMLDLRNSIRSGFLAGVFSDGKETAEGSAFANFSKFMKSFTARYRFFAKTNATITFKWFADSKTTSHGARNYSYALVRMEKVPTDEDAARAADVIKFAIESKESASAAELMKVALGVEFKPEKPPEIGDKAKAGGAKKDDKPKTPETPKDQKPKEDKKDK